MSFTAQPMKVKSLFSLGFFLSVFDLCAPLLFLGFDLGRQQVWKKNLVQSCLKYHRNSEFFVLHISFRYVTQILFSFINSFTWYFNALFYSLCSRVHGSKVFEIVTLMSVLSVLMY